MKELADFSIDYKIYVIITCTYGFFATILNAVMVPSPLEQTKYFFVSFVIISLMNSSDSLKDSTGSFCLISHTEIQFYFN